MSEPGRGTFRSSPKLIMNMKERSATATTGQTKRGRSRELALAQQTGTLTEFISEVRRMVPEPRILLFGAYFSYDESGQGHADSDKLALAWQNWKRRLPMVAARCRHGQILNGAPPAGIFRGLGHVRVGGGFDVIHRSHYGREINGQSFPSARDGYYADYRNPVRAGRLRRKRRRLKSKLQQIGNAVQVRILKRPRQRVGGHSGAFDPGLIRARDGGGQGGVIY